MQSDSRPTRALRQNIAAAHFERVYLDTAEFARRAVRRLGVTESDVEDVTQDVFVHVHRHLPGFEGRCALKTWIFGFVVSAVRNYRRKQQRRSDRRALLELSWQVTQHAKTLDPYELAARFEAESILKRVAHEIGEDKAALLVLSEFEGRSMHEISALLGVNVNTLYSRRRIGRVEFDEALARLLNAGVAEDAQARLRNER
jgi:RNA polymerase sigma-70 factor (ECF subfamily)